MKQRTQFWLSLIFIGIFTLAILFGPSTAIVGAFLYAGLLGTGILFVRVALRRMA